MLLSGGDRLADHHPLCALNFAAHGPTRGKSFVGRDEMSWARLHEVVRLLADHPDVAIPGQNALERFFPFQIDVRSVSARGAIAPRNGSYRLFAKRGRFG